MRVDELTAELVLDGRDRLGEAPVWDRARGSLLWVDIDAGLVHRLHADGSGRDTLALGCPVGAAVPRRSGGLALALADGFALLGLGESSPGETVRVPLGEPGSRMNDAACDSAGRLWGGTLSGSRRPTAALFRWSGGPAADCMLTGVTVSNGIGWSADDRRMFYVDTATGSVDVFAFDAASGTIANRRRAFAVDRGRPDGIAIDATGAVWVALWGAGAVHRYAPDGTLLARVSLPIAHVTSCCFGGRELDTLYITSARRTPAAPHAGGLFACVPGCTGLPTSEFEG